MVVNDGGGEGGRFSLHLLHRLTIPRVSDHEDRSLPARAWVVGSLLADGQRREQPLAENLIVAHKVRAELAPA